MIKKNQKINNTAGIMAAASKLAEFFPSNDILQSLALAANGMSGAARKNKESGFGAGLTFKQVAGAVPLYCGFIEVDGQKVDGVRLVLDELRSIKKECGDLQSVNKLLVIAKNEGLTK